MFTMPQAAAPLVMLLNAGGFFRRLGRWTHALVAYSYRRTAVKALRQLDDRELRDIGLVRSQIERAVWGLVDPDLGRLR